MDNRTIRYNNVRYLVDLIGGVSNFAEKIGKGQSQVSQFAGTNPIKGIGNKIAREIEAALQKDHGWLDVAHPELWESHGDMGPTQSQRMGDMVQSQSGQSQGQIQGEPWKSHLMALEPWEDGDEPDPDEVDLPFFDDVSFAAGDGSFLIQVGMNAQRKLRFLRATLEAAGVRIEDAACAKNSGTSMEDLIRDGATIGIDISKAQYPIKDGKIYAMFHGGMLRIKYLYRLPGGGIRLRSHNRDEYEDEDLFGDKLNDFRVLGWVFWWSTVDRW